MDWKYGERYNNSGEFNPRLIACEDCSEYLEPEEFSPNDKSCNKCNQQMSKTGLFNVSYDGYLLISAKDQDEAFAIASGMLAKSGIVNDGDSGEWAIADITDEDNYTNG